MTDMLGATGTLRVPAAGAAGGLVLRAWRADDAETVIEAYGDPDIARWTTRAIAGPEDAQWWLDLQRRGREDGTRLSFAICADQLGPAEGSVLGNISLRWSEDTGREVAEVGYWTMAHARGHGVAPRALEALSAWAFEAFAHDGLRRVELLHQVDNLASCRVAEKGGYRFERILPAHPPYPRDGHLHVREAG
ncbi:GNAT family N-acetyltransferase [Streptomyces sp. NPDC006530]|uniref:GNAT family N-acetyltransferase n=1 Tax=Streptomyces sp. NPDC006530 TaxID=3364750 RepID=UPI0036C0BC26